MQVRFAPLFLSLTLLTPVHALEDYVEPGSLRLSHVITLEGVLSKLRPGWQENPGGINRANKTYSIQGNEERPWKAEWGQRLVTEAATRLSPDIFGRTLFEVQGEYADRLWRPVNTHHDADINDENLILREAEGRIDKDNWYLHGFSGVEHGDWFDKGDFFRLYPSNYPMRDYLGSSAYFGVYPQNWREDQYRNISRRAVARGGELGVSFREMDGAVAYGDELAWGIRESVYGRWRIPIRTTKLTFVYKDEDAPHSLFNEDERNRAYALSWAIPFEEGHKLDVGVLYNPYRVGEPYKVARNTSLGSGVLGSSTAILQRTSKKEDALAARVRFEHYLVVMQKLINWSLDLTRAEILAGNKEKVDFNVATDFLNYFRGDVLYTYQRPVERAIPFLFEGTPANMGPVAASPRGPESPFNVDWTNREAVFILTTLQFDPTPGSNYFKFDPKSLAMWNVNPEEDARFVFAVQYKMSDYRDTTDRQYYHNEVGEIVWESAAHTGAWPTDHPLHEVRFLSQGKLVGWKWVLGLAGGQSPAVLGLAYSNDPSAEKPITEYFSVEGRFERWPFGLWWHYGSGIWGPEENIHPFFGISYDRLWGLGVSYNITKNTTWDVGYLAARQDDSLFFSRDLGSFDEIRTLFSHRFGFLFQFEGPSRKGYQAR